MGRCDGRLALTSSSRRGPAPGALSPYVLAATFLRLVAARDPTVVALDDANLADDESLTALAFTARHVASVPLGRVTAISGPPGSRFAATIGPLVELQGIINLDPLDQHHITVTPTCWPSSRMSIRFACKRRSTA